MKVNYPMRELVGLLSAAESAQANNSGQPRLAQGEKP